MIKLIVGNKGSGKTKTLVEQINQTAKTAKGNIVCIEKAMKLTYDLDHSVRLIDIEAYNISGYDAFYGFVAGLYASNYDLTDVFVDGILKIGGRNLEELGATFEKLEKLNAKDGVNIVFTVSCDSCDLPESVKKYL